MSKASGNHIGLMIVTELLEVTREMADRLDDSDFLVESIGKREELMQEFDRIKAANPRAAAAIDKDKSQIQEMRGEMLALDKKINRALLNLRNEAKHELESSATSQKVLNYTNNAISSSGSYMDYKN